MTIGQRIKSRRLELGLSVDELANKLGKNRATVYRYEKDDIKDLPITVLEPLAKVLDTTPADLMGWEQIDSRVSGKEASDEIYQKFAKNILRFHGEQKELNEIYVQLSSDNQNRVLTYSKGLLSTQQLDNELLAAHARTDIEHTQEGQAHDEAIMDDDDEWV